MPSLRRCAAWVLAAVTAAAVAPGAGADDRSPQAQALQVRHAGLTAALARSPFGRPLVMASESSGGATRGDVDAVIDEPFASLAAALRQPRHWCRIFILQTNVKRCTVDGDAADAALQVAVARRYTDPVDDAYRVAFRYTVSAAEPDFLAVGLSADEGPVGTHDYRLRLEAAPIDASRSYIHLSYGYRMGVAARLATRVYLATAGRDKVGFSAAGRDARGRPIPIGGIRGIAERNTMRYFLAIESFLATRDAPPAVRLERRLRRFHAALERYPAQLHETTLDEYLAMKRVEAAPD